MFKSFSVWLFLLPIAAFADISELSEAQLEGRRIAREVRELRLTEDAHGVLKIFKGRTRIAELPFRLEIIVTSTNWSAIYTTESTNQVFAASLIVIHTSGQPNEYKLNGDGTNHAVSLSGNDIMAPFAGSDYWVADLGVEFLHWPEQKLLKKEVHRSQSCYVLESINSSPGTNGYTRVVTWIDIDTGGIVEAEAYDAKGKLKIFEPTDVEKVNGQYRVRTLEIRNRRIGTRTVIEFNFKGK